MKLLLEVIGSMRVLANSLEAMANEWFQEVEVEEETVTKEPEKTGKTAAKKGQAKKETKSATKQKPEEKLLTLEEVRAVLAEKSRAGYTAEVKELLKKHGANKLSEIDPKEYAALLQETEVL